MNNRFIIDQLSKSESIDPNSINRLYKINMMLNFMEIRSSNPRMTQNQICKQLGTSDSTIKRYRDDIEMDSPYNRNNYKKRRPKKEPDNTTAKKGIDESSKNKIIEKRIKNRLKNEIKGGNTLSGTYIDNDNHLSAKELIEQAFKGTVNE